MVCGYAPRAPEDGGRPWRLMGASGRPLSFTVSCHPGWPAMRVITTMCALLVIVPRVCLADGFFRCGSWLVSTDTSVADLLKKCGKPSSEEVSTQDVENKYGAKVGTSTTQIWRYDRDTRPGPLIVTIVDGRIQRMTRGK
jgi:hypothetical protein